jgi:hypothetical protein
MTRVSELPLRERAGHVASPVLTGDAVRDMAAVKREVPCNATCGNPGIPRDPLICRWNRSSGVLRKGRQGIFPFLGAQTPISTRHAAATRFMLKVKGVRRKGHDGSREKAYCS